MNKAWARIGWVPGDEKMQETMELVTTGSVLTIESIDELASDTLFPFRQAAIDDNPKRPAPKKRRITVTVTLEDM